MKLLEFIFQSFAHFVGFCILLGAVGDWVYRMWQVFWNYKKEKLTKEK